VDTYIVKIDIGAAIVGQNEITNRVRALDRVFVPVKGLEEPGILGGDKVARLFICPQLEQLLAQIQLRSHEERTIYS
jgi:hypothetical protein